MIPSTAEELREHFGGCPLADIKLLRAQCAAVLEQFGEVWDRAADLETLKDGVVEDHPLPVSRPAREWADPLFDSRRDYLTQLEAYKVFQGKAPTAHGGLVGALSAQALAPF